MSAIPLSQFVPKMSVQFSPVHRIWTGITPGSVLCGDQGLCRILALEFSLQNLSTNMIFVKLETNS